MATATLLAVSASLALSGGPSVAQPEGGEIVPRATRDVTPPGITPGPKVDGPLVRVPAPPPPPEPPRWRRFFLPRTIDGATFVVDDLTIRVSGVAPLAVDKVCSKADGTAWPCGRTALFSFRMFLRGRAVECLFPPLEGATQVIAPCRIGSIDLAHWLLRQGWAEPDENATDDYRSAAEAARCEGLGMWRGVAAGTDCPASETG